jgi:hypothetical protein
MWIFFNTGFISIVQDRNNSDLLIVRARRPEVLTKLWPQEPITVTNDSDYKYRVFISRPQMVKALSQEILTLDYGNFKSSVSDPTLSDLYHHIWTLGLEYQK